MFSRRKLIAKRKDLNACFDWEEEKKFVHDSRGSMEELKGRRQTSKLIQSVLKTTTKESNNTGFTFLIYVKLSVYIQINN